MTLLLFYFLLAIGVSFFCSVAEAVLLSVRPSYTKALERTDKKSAAVLNRLQNNLDRPLAAILAANTVAHTVGAAGVGAQASVLFGSESLGITSGVLTFFILVFSEIIPKTLGATYWQSLAPLFGRLIWGLTLFLLPVVWLSEKLTRLLSRTGASAFTFSRDEITAMAEIGAKEGVLDTKDYKIVANLMKLHKISVRSIMTPRAVVFSVQQDMAVQAFFTQYSEKPFSRILMYETTPDQVTGYVLKTDMLMAQARDEFDTRLSEMRRDVRILPDTLTVSDVFDRLLHERSHMAILVNEYGTLQGLVTLEDVVETLIGFEIIDEQDTVEDMQAHAQKLWRARMQAIGVDPDSILDSK
ncbi:MAG: hemolysin family protein [Alphaproteobacteria bacterium]|nr:hemolysin family protein [Alphaproteobacteria bacterium]